jgi:hypothetical protein
MNESINSLLRRYLLVLMGGLLLQGLGSLIFRLEPALPAHSPLLVRGAFGIDFWHALVHISWGVAGLVILSVGRSATRLAGLALGFGVFYSAFGLLGVLVQHPMGLELDAPENVFHLLAGPLSLAIGWWALRSRVEGDRP